MRNICTSTYKLIPIFCIAIALSFTSCQNVSEFEDIVGAKSHMENALEVSNETESMQVVSDNVGEEDISSEGSSTYSSGKTRLPFIPRKGKKTDKKDSKYNSKKGGQSDNNKESQD